MKIRVISVRQPWAWLIIHGGKDIENRDWSTRVRGRVLIHAGKSSEVDDVEAAELCEEYGVNPPQTFERGGIIGSVEIVDCVTHSASRWFVGAYGFVLRDPRPIPFTPYTGKLGFFEVEVDAAGNITGGNPPVTASITATPTRKRRKVKGHRMDPLPPPPGFTSWEAYDAAMQAYKAQTTKSIVKVQAEDQTNED